jgi:hypothetical protein
MKGLPFWRVFFFKPLLAFIVCFAMIPVSGCNPAWIQTALNDLPVVLQIVTSILGIVGIAQNKGGIDPSVATVVQAIGAQAKSDLQLAQQVYNDYTTALAADKPTVLGKVDAALTTVQTDLNGLLAAFHVSDKTLQAEIAAGVSLALTTVMAIQSLIPTPTPAVKAARVLRVPHQPLKPADLRAAYNSIIQADYPSAVI